MLRKMLIAAAGFGLAACATAPAPAPSFTDILTQNTLKASSALGEMTLLFNADQTMSLNVGGMPLEGTWKIADNNLCVTPTGIPETCTPIDTSRKVGETWTVTNAQGQEITLSIVPGRPAGE